MMRTILVCGVVCLSSLVAIASIQAQEKNKKGPPPKLTATPSQRKFSLDD